MSYYMSLEELKLEQDWELFLIVDVLCEWFNTYTKTI